MAEAAITPGSRTRLGLSDWIGIVTGIVMPVAAALLYPTYVHQMPSTWVEWTRLMELPFVACEMVMIHVALKAGYRDRLVWAKMPKDVIVAVGLLAVGLTVSSVLVSRNVPASVAFSLITVIHLRFAAAIFYLAQRRPSDDFSALLPWLGLGLIALTILTVWWFAFPPPAESVLGGRIEWASALPGFINVRHFGSWTGAIAAGFMVAILYAPDEPTLTTKSLYVLAAGLTFWSGTRAAVLAMAIVAIIIWVSLRRLPSLRSVIQFGALSALAMLGAALFWANSPEFVLVMRDNLQSMDAVTSGRVALWHATFLRWLDAPLFGWGSGSTFWEVNVGWAHTQPHNAVLQFLISWGIIGAVGGLWLLGRAIAATHRTGMEIEALRPLTGMLYSLLFMSLLEGMLHYPRFIMPIMIAFAALFAERERRTRAAMSGASDHAGAAYAIT